MSSSSSELLSPVVVSRQQRRRRFSNNTNRSKNGRFRRHLGCYQGRLRAVIAPRSPEMEGCASVNVVIDPALLSAKVLDQMTALEDGAVPKGTFKPENGRVLTAEMWTIVTEWMGEVCEAEKQSIDVCALAINYLNRFMEKRSFEKNRFQLLAITCLWLASKMREVNPLTCDVMLMYTQHSYTKQELLQWEFIVLRAIDWTLSIITPYDFLPHLFVRALPADVPLHLQEMAYANSQKIIATCIMDVTLQRIRPSIITCASIVAVVAGLTWMYAVDMDGVGIKLLLRLEKITDNDKHAIYQVATVINPRVMCAGLEEMPTPMRPFAVLFD